MEKPSIKRIYLDIMSIIVLGSHLELKHLHYFTPNEFPYSLFGTDFIMLLVIPFMSVVVRILGLLDAYIRKSPVVLEIEQNKISAYVEGTQIVSVDGSFSEPTSRIANAERLRKSI